eukprot:CAMPEP_0196661416 /NCGR_PEP_ID=MMETSP1086-20130531/44149_1 /TAXON_ID=77921 /ORGANISM="Cyanoptyche  gloeocystis , Strain SAG4.97" /LENGTH=109 /DNA_ID=CAMNT_0041996293 /DNA_START=6 /DNA_END=331 /DNA_ORIENTATION=-
MIQCPVCHAARCHQCNCPWHTGFTCEAFQQRQRDIAMQEQQRRQNEIYEQQRRNEEQQRIRENQNLEQWRQDNGPRGEAATNSWVAAHAKRCPRCRVPVEKTTGCNHMT